ncbi:MAG: cupin domain-containing protein, partial [Pseudomonadota bacterium]
RLVRLSPGDFIWHIHQDADEMFLVFKGSLVIKFRERDVRLGPGEFLIVPRGVEHMPSAETEVYMMLVEPLETLNTGDVENERTVRELNHI